MPTVFRIVCSMVLLLPGIAAAHPAHDFAMSGIDGVLHPFTGIDHVLAMIAAGLWASHLGKRSAITVPIAFAFTMLIGAALSVLGLKLPAVEPMIALSVVMLGVVIAARVRINESLGAALVATFAVFHGYAHANETSALQLPFVVGFSVATMSLNVVGVWIGARLLPRESNAARITGSLIGAGGAMLLLGL